MREGNLKGNARQSMGFRIALVRILA